MVDEGPTLKRLWRGRKAAVPASSSAPATSLWLWAPPSKRIRKRPWVIKFIRLVRLGISKDWNSKWYANKAEFAGYLAADLKVREMLRKKLAQAGISKILIERPAKTARVTIHTARPGVVIGKRGEDIEKLRKEVSEMMGVPAHINVTEVRKPELDAQLVAESIAQQLERRIMFRRAMKRSVGNAMRLGALGIKVNVGGRLNGAEIARSEWYREGRVPLNTLRADIDYGFA